MLNIARPSKISDATFRGSTGSGVDTEFECAVGGEHENKRGRAFGVQNRKPGCPGSVLVWGVQKVRGTLAFVLKHQFDPKMDNPGVSRA